MNYLKKKLTVEFKIYLLNMYLNILLFWEINSLSALSLYTRIENDIFVIIICQEKKVRYKNITYILSSITAVSC